jgi:hypothetical protein
VQNYPTAKGLRLAEKQGLVKVPFSVKVETADPTVQALFNNLLLPQRFMTEEEQVLMRSFLHKRLTEKFQGVPLTPEARMSMEVSLVMWLREWEHVRA